MMYELFTFNVNKLVTLNFIYIFILLLTNSFYGDTYYPCLSHYK